MDVKLTGKYAVKSDGSGYVLYNPRETRKKKLKDGSYAHSHVVYGYYATLSSVLKDFIDRHVHGSKVTTIEGLRKQILEARKIVDKVLGGER